MLESQMSSNSPSQFATSFPSFHKTQKQIVFNFEICFHADGLHQVNNAKIIIDTSALDGLRGDNDLMIGLRLLLSSLEEKSRHTSSLMC